MSASWAGTRVSSGRARAAWPSTGRPCGRPIPASGRVATLPSARGTSSTPSPTVSARPRRSTPSTAAPPSARCASSLPTVPHDRRIGFAEVETGYGEAEARLEAQRCLRCFDNVMLQPELCILCGLCVDVCPYDCISIVRADSIAAGTAEQSALLLDESVCIRCGLCVNRCPPGALLMTHAKELADG